ncbi:MAG TPA: DNRLRE domain-containing protein, partial [Actinomycetota bacterium]
FVASTGAFSDAFSIVAGPPPPPDTTPPSVPQGLVGTPVNGTTVGLSWQPSTDDVGVHHYDVLRDGAALATSATTAYTDATVVPGATHVYAVRAVDAAGNASAASIPVSVTTPAGTGASLVFGPSADTYVSQANPTANFGGAKRFAVDASPQEHALLRFAVTGVGAAPVVGATLRLYNTNGSSMGGSVFPVADTSWNESTVTWNTAPPAGPAPAGSLGAVTAGTWYEVDVSSIVTGDGVYSMRLITTSSNGADYTSREGASGFAPELVVEPGAPP